MYEVVNSRRGTALIAGDEMAQLLGLETRDLGDIALAQRGTPEEGQPLQVVVGVQPPVCLCPDGLDRPVTLLPRADPVRGQPGTVGCNTNRV